MPRDLFGDVTRPSISIGNRKWYTVPVSLLSHAVILAMIVIVPILAAPLMPSVFADSDMAYITKVLPPPPPPPAIRPETITPPENPYAAPLDPPDGIAPERDVPPDIPDKPIIGVVGGADVRDIEVTPPPPVIKDPPPQPVRPGFQGVRTPVKTRHVDPVYPQFAIISRTQGIVIIEATIGEDGHVINARVLRSVALLDDAALSAVRLWQFTPTLLNGKPVPVIMTVTVNFTLNK